MKTLFSLSLFLMIPFLALSQPSGKRNVHDPAAREKIKAAHAAYITQRIELTPSEAERFWPVYREYDEKRRAVRNEMREVRRSQKSEEEKIAQDLEIKQRELDLEKEYTKKFVKVIPAEKLARLRGAETDFRKMLLRQIQDRRRTKR